MWQYSRPCNVAPHPGWRQRKANCSAPHLPGGLGDRHQFLLLAFGREVVVVDDQGGEATLGAEGDVAAGFLDADGEVFLGRGPVGLIFTLQHILYSSNVPLPCQEKAISFGWNEGTRGAVVEESVLLGLIHYGRRSEYVSLRDSERASTLYICVKAYLHYT